MVDAVVMILTASYARIVHHRESGDLLLPKQAKSEMQRPLKFEVWLAIALAIAFVIAMTVTVIERRRNLVLKGVVIRQDADPSKQVPVPDTEVTAITEGLTRQARSDETGLFTIVLPKGFRSRRSVTLRFEHPNYSLLQLDETIGDELFVVRMLPAKAQDHALAANQPEQVLSNIRVRYVFRTTDVVDVGSEVRTFQVANTGNLPCADQGTCSPDKKWKAAVESVSLDAGEGNEFRNVRVSCIAGPCPFTRTERQVVSPDGRHLDVSARNWSDTATFLVEAEVIRPAENDLVRQSYPAIFGPSLSFSLPASAEGPSIEAELNGQPIVFPLGPNLSLVWAQCTQTKVNDQVTAYRCQLKQGYRFQ
jgi:hypothetical protein